VVPERRRAYRIHTIGTISELTLLSSLQHFWVGVAARITITDWCSPRADLHDIAEEASDTSAAMDRLTGPQPMCLVTRHTRSVARGDQQCIMHPAPHVARWMSVLHIAGFVEQYTQVQGVLRYTPTHSSLAPQYCPAVSGLCTDEIEFIDPPRHRSGAKVRGQNAFICGSTDA
jgi:hypothetical protein